MDNFERILFYRTFPILALALFGYVLITPWTWWGYTETGWQILGGTLLRVETIPMWSVVLWFEGVFLLWTTRSVGLVLLLFSIFAIRYWTLGPDGGASLVMILLQLALCLFGLLRFFSVEAER